MVALCCASKTTATVHLFRPPLKALRSPQLGKEMADVHARLGAGAQSTSRILGGLAACRGAVELRKWIGSRLLNAENNLGIGGLFGGMCWAVTEHICHRWLISVLTTLTIRLS
jgi:hypothetical protein